MTKRDDAIVASVENLITFMTLADITEFKVTHGERSMSPMEFNGAEPVLGREWWHEENYSIFSDVTMGDLGKPLDVRMITFNEDDEQGYAAQRFRQVTPKQVRGEVARPSRYLVRHSALIIDGDGSATATRTLFGSGGPYGWRCVGHRAEPNAFLDEYWADKFTIALGLAFNQEYYWSVQLGWVGSPMIRIPTSPMGAREVFRLRDIPEGRQRRAALRQWITDYWRVLHRTPEDEGYVRRHLRGAQDFTWNGLRCIITPSDDDLRTEQKLKDERAEMKIEGLDRRPALVRG